MAYESTHMLFRSLSNEETETFRAYARTNEPPTADKWTITHPVCRAEWRRLGKVDANYPITTEELDAAEA